MPFISTIAGVKVERWPLPHDNSQYIEPYLRPEEFRIGLAPVPRFAAPRSSNHHSMRTLFKARQRLKSTRIRGKTRVSCTSSYHSFTIVVGVHDHASELRHRIRSISLKRGHVIKGASESSKHTSNCRGCPTLFRHRCLIKPSTQPKQNTIDVFNSASLPLVRLLWPENDPHLFVRVDSSVKREIYIWKVFHKAVNEVVPQGWNAPVFRWAESAKDGLTSVNDEVCYPCTTVHLSSAPAETFYRRFFYERASK